MNDDATSDWRSLLPCMDVEEFRELLGEHGAARLGELLAAFGFSTRTIRTVPRDFTGLTLSARVLREMYGHPKALLE